MSTTIMGLRCPLCGDDAAPALEWMARLEATAPGTAVCDPCAERVANAWNHAHSGRWLTWKNAPAPKPKKQRIGAALRTAVFERDLYRCLQCGTHIDLTADHVIPESLGGPTELHNLQTLCRPCNCRKGAR